MHIICCIGKIYMNIEIYKFKNSWGKKMKYLNKCLNTQAAEVFPPARERVRKNYIHMKKKKDCQKQWASLKISGKWLSKCHLIDTRQRT